MRGWFVVFMLSIASMVMAQSPQPDRKTQATQKTTKDDQRGTTRLPLVVEVLPTEDAKKEAARNEAQQEEQLKFERESAEAMRFFTGLLVAIGALQLIVFAWQARRLRQTVEATEKAATAAKQSADSFQQSERAWLSFTKVIHDEFVNGITERGERWNGTMFRIEWINSGRTPAIRSSIFREGSVKAAGTGVPTFSPSADDEQRQAPLIPGIKVTSLPFYVRDTDIERLRKRECGLFLYAKATYEDVFVTSVRRHTEVCLQVEYDGNRSDGRPNFTFSAVGPQNGAS